MYVIATHIPIYTDGAQHFTDISWQRDLLLARDWLAPPYGGLRLVAPSLPLHCNVGQAMSLVPIGLTDGIQVVPSFDARGRARKFWMRDRIRWNTDINNALMGARIFHTSACDVFRPLSFMAHAAATRRKVPTVFVGPDMDLHVTLPGTARGRLECAIFDFWMRRTLQQSQLVMLKEGLVYDRYRHLASNVRSICHSMHHDVDVIDSARLTERLHGVQSGEVLKSVYVGRFVARKGLHDAIAAVAIALGKGIEIEFHLYGGGDEEQALRTQVAELKIEKNIIFHGVVEYGQDFLKMLSEFDVFLFMPTEEDTPRALFDTMAAGLPLIGTRIPFLETQVAKHNHGILVNVGDSRSAAEHLCSLKRNHESLCSLARNARHAGSQNSVEHWYKRRAEWTHEL